MRCLITSILLLSSSQLFASDFGNTITVSASQNGIFHHFESSGRTSLAVANGTVAIVWEDNRTGVPQIFVAFKSRSQTQFTQAIQVSIQGPAYEPAITAIGEQFVIGWESQDRLWLRQVSPARLGNIVPLTTATARQLTLTSTLTSQPIAAWSEQDPTSFHIRIADIAIEHNQLQVHNSRPVDNSSDRKEQLYPSVAVTQKGIVVAWEDRRFGATRIFTSFAPAGGTFEPYQTLNDFLLLSKFGQGTGAMRVVLASDQHSKVIAIWLDKRDFRQGYDVYAALSEDGGKTFGADEKVQDPLGDNLPQWHASIAMSPRGQVFAAWDDSRDGSPDIWFSTRTHSSWSEDDVWPSGSGNGAQTLPALLYEGETLHIAWLDRDKKSSAIRYLQK